MTVAVWELGVKAGSNTPEDVTGVLKLMGRCPSQASREEEEVVSSIRHVASVKLLL